MHYGEFEEARGWVILNNARAERVHYSESPTRVPIMHSCIGLYSPFQLCKIKILYCKWIERGYKYIFYVKSSNCTILNVSAVIYVIMFMYNLEINYLSIYLTILYRHSNTTF